MMVMTNACRIAPTAYRNTYLTSAPTILSSSVYPPVPPLQWSLGLNKSSRYHSNDLATTANCGLQHNSCNGTSWATRVSSYYPNAITKGENIAAGYFDPTSTINALLIDSFGGPIPADGSGTDGHRKNIMSSTFTEFGNGYAIGPNSYGRYYTQDFAKPTTASAICSPIPSATHVFQSGMIHFMANFYDTANAAPRSAQVFIDGVPSTMAVYLGTAARGTYRYSTTTSATCRSYHFEFRDASNTLYRYPAHGEFRTFGEASSTENFRDSTVAPTQPPCAADFDRSGTANIDDIFAFLTAWFAHDLRADFNGSGSVTIDDIFAFLTIWDAGC